MGNCYTKILGKFNSFIPEILIFLTNKILDDDLTDRSFERAALTNREIFRDRDSEGPVATI